MVQSSLIRILLCVFSSFLAGTSFKGKKFFVTSGFWVSPFVTCLSYREMGEFLDVFLTVFRGADFNGLNISDLRWDRKSEFFQGRVF